MKKRIVFVLATVSLSMSLMIGCETTSDIPKNTETVSIVESETPEPTEAPHEHNYTEKVTVEATCEADGEKTFTCECGDTYTEVIPATGHVFENYVSNNNATYEADGTETATCSMCGVVDTRTAEGSMLAYTYTDMDTTKYAKSTVNVRNMPIADSEKLGDLSTNDEVKVTGQCNETGWYRIEYDGNVAYVSDSYLVDNKVETQTATNNNNTSSVANASSDFPNELLTRYVTPDGKISYFYCTEDCGWSTHGWHQVWYTCNNYNNATFGHETSPGQSYETTMSTFTICDDMDGYVQAATANGLNARSSVATPWKTADGKKICAFCP